MKEFTVQITDEEEKALLTDMLSIENWLSNAIHNKARQCMDKIILDHSDRQPSKVSASERAEIVRKARVESAAERMLGAER